VFNIKVLPAVRAFFGILLCASLAHAESGLGAPRTAFDVLGLPVNRLSPRSLFDFQGKVVDVSDHRSVQKDHVAEAAEADRNAPQFVSSNPKSHIVSPNQDPRVRINPEAPGPFKAMAVANQDGDRELAALYADQFIRYQINMMFEAREIMQLIGESLIRQGQVDDEEYMGFSQFMNIQSAGARANNKSALKPTHQDAMRRIKADPKSRADIFFFFSLSDQWSRSMAPDVERLWQVAKGDSNLKMVSLTIGAEPKAFVNSYREYTGLTAPIFDGTKVAKAFQVRYVPTLVVVSPTTGTAYVKTGHQSFERMYEFVRTVQGLPANVTPAVQQLMERPVGQLEVAKVKGGMLPSERKVFAAQRGRLRKVSGVRVRKSDGLSRF